MSNLKKMVKENSQLLVIGIYIAFVIAITQVISNEIQKYFIDNPNYFSAFIMFIFIVVMYGFFIFILVKISSAFRNFLLRMFGVQSGFVSTEQTPVKETKDPMKAKLPKTTLPNSDLLFMLIPSILGIIAFSVSVYAFWGLFSKIATVQTVSSEVINGLLAISGILFAFQAFFLKKPKRPIRRLVFAVIFIIEVLTLSYIGFSYIGDVSNSIFPSIATFFFVFFSLTFTLANTAFFIVYDLFFPTQETK